MSRTGSTHSTDLPLLRRGDQLLRPRLPHAARHRPAALPFPHAARSTPRRPTVPPAGTPTATSARTSTSPSGTAGSPSPASRSSRWNRRRRELYGAGPALAPWEIARPVGPDGALATEFTLDLQPPEITDEVRDYAAPSFAPGRPLIEVLRDLTSRIYRDFTYRSGSTTVSTRVNDVLAAQGRRVPGLRPAGDRLPARQRACRQLCFGLSGHRPAAGQGADGRHRRHPCLGVGVDARRTSGWGSTRPTTRWSTSATSSSAGVATMPMCRRCAASSTPTPRAVSSTSSVDVAPFEGEVLHA